jgi:hypothetical protein
MSTLRDPRNEAMANLRSALHSEREFPQNVFDDQWGNFLFLNSDRMFDSRFVAQVKTLLHIESATCAFMGNLDDTGDRPVVTDFVFDRQTTPDAYRAILAGKPEGFGWLHGPDRYGCISDSGGWCFYCERELEIAVVAFRKGTSPQPYQLVLTQLEAVNIDKAIGMPLSFGFSEQARPKELLRELLQQYATRT